MMSRHTKIEITCLLSNDYEYVLFNSPISQCGELFVIDLTSGVSSGLSSARQLASQLLLEIPDRIMAGSNTEAMSSLDFIATWVDSEGRGDIVIQKSCHIAKLLATEFIHLTDANLLLLLGEADVANIHDEEKLFLWFLLNHEELQSQVLIQTTDKEKLTTIFPWLTPNWIEVPEVAMAFETNLSDEDSLITLIPGLLPGAFVEKLVLEGYGLSIQLLALNGGDYLINPGQRKLSNAQVDSTRASFNFILRLFPRIYAALLTRGYLPEDQDIEMLTKIAWAAAGQGGISLAQDILEALLVYCQQRRLNQYFAVLMELQKLRISAQSYLNAARDDADYSLIPVEGVRDYKITLGWGRVLSGDAKGAFECFSSIAAPIVSDIKTPIDLYLCNIYALVLFRAGKTDEAIAIEHAINDHLANLAQPNYHLTYINNFNLARLYRHLNDHDKEQAYFNQVLATTDGLRTESDQIYFNLTQAAIFEKQGQTLKAVIATWRACVHWLACEVPEAIGWRTLLAIYSKRQAIHPTLLPDISDKLVELLLARVKTAGLVVPKIDYQPPSYIKISALPNLGKFNNAKTYSSKDFGVLIGLPYLIRSSLYSTEHDRLSTLVTAIFQLGTQNSLTEVLTLLVDDCYGHDILESDDGEILAAIRWGIRNEQTNCNSVLNRVSLKMGQGIASVELNENALINVVFKRYLPPFSIPEAMQAVLAKLYKQNILTLAEFIAELNLANEDEIWNTLNLLESERVCELVIAK